MKKITPFLWFNGNAEVAMDFYVSVFKNSKILKVTRFGKGYKQLPGGEVVVGSFVLDGQEFYALNGGPEFSFTPAISFLVHCQSQEEIDYYWQKLTADGGEEVECGWLRDKFGLSWQITPTVLMELIQDKDTARAERVHAAICKMKKIDIKAIQLAAA